MISWPNTDVTPIKFIKLRLKLDWCRFERAQYYFMKNFNDISKKKKNSMIKFLNHHSSIFMELIFQHGELYLHDEL